MKIRNSIALISRIRDMVNQFLIRELAQAGVAGIVPSHGDILAHLFRGKKYTMKELAEKIHRTKPTITVLVEKLVELGYVTKSHCPEDGRVTYISLTERGQELEPKFAAITEKLEARLYRNISVEEADALRRTMTVMERNMQEGTGKDLEEP